MYRRPTLMLCLFAACLAACGKQPAPATVQPPAPAASSSPADAPPSADVAPSLLAAPPIDRPPLADLKNRRWPGVNNKAQPPAVHYHNGKLVQDDTPPSLQLFSEFQNYKQGKIAVPAYPGDMIYMSVIAQTQGQTPLKNIPVEIHSRKGNTTLLMADHTDGNGELEFRVLATQLGEDVVTVAAAGQQSDFFIVVEQPPRGEWLGGMDLKGVTSWDLLMSAQVKIGRDLVEASFPAPLQALGNKSIRLVGFMLPLGATEEQKHFLLSANPPGCFFHPPGGPSSAVEVYADQGVAISYDPLVMEGRFELVPRSDGGILYKLHEARLVSKSS